MAHRVGRTPRRAPRVFARPTVARSNAVPLTLAARHERSIHAFNSSVAASRLVSSRTEPNRTHPIAPTARSSHDRHTTPPTRATRSHDRHLPRPRRTHRSSQSSSSRSSPSFLDRARMHSRIAFARLFSLVSRASPRLDSTRVPPSPTVSHRLTHLASSSPSSVVRRRRRRRSSSVAHPPRIRQRHRVGVVSRDESLSFRSTCARVSDTHSRVYTMNTPSECGYGDMDTRGARARASRPRAGAVAVSLGNGGS